ncbi:hypothetical protein Bbelb_338810 [Branchiostoma belcheri]|nr:hypothetical protein Bbelb_338810 [Branchiostoma belcheri]
MVISGDHGAVGRQNDSTRERRDQENIRMSQYLEFACGWPDVYSLGSGTVLDSLRISKDVDLPQARFWIRVDYPEPWINPSYGYRRDQEKYQDLEFVYGYRHVPDTSPRNPRSPMTSEPGLSPLVSQCLPRRKCLQVSVTANSGQRLRLSQSAPSIFIYAQGI